MTIVYLNGEYMPLEAAKISVLDRGFLFADGVYEVIPVYGGRLFRLQQHLNRLADSLAGIKLPNPMDHAAWSSMLEELVARNDGGECSVYLQITRGAGDGREHIFPEGIAPTVFAMVSPMKPVAPELLQNGLQAVTMDDNRWQLCHLKTTALLANVLMRQAAKEQDAEEAILIRDGYATECSASNLFIVDNGVLVTPPKSAHLLPGVTRDLVLELAEEHNIKYAEREIAEAQLHNAAEIWITSSSKEVLAVTRLNGVPVGNGQPGPLWRQMFDHYRAYKAGLHQEGTGSE